jgi:hypothetical protein
LNGKDNMFFHNQRIPPTRLKSRCKNPSLYMPCDFCMFAFMITWVPGIKMKRTFLCAPNSLRDSNVSPKLNTTEGQGVRACSLARSIIEGYRGMLELRDGTRKKWQASLTHTDLHKTNTKWLVHSWSTFGARMSHGQLGHTRFTMAWTWGKPPPSPL